MQTILVVCDSCSRWGYPGLNRQGMAAFEWSYDGEADRCRQCTEHAKESLRPTP